MNRLMARNRIWIALALALPVVVSLIGVLLFQGICSFWCRQVPIFGVVGFLESAMVACCASTMIVGLGYLALWQRSIGTAHHRTHAAWLGGSALIMLITFIPIVMILAPFLPNRSAIHTNTPLWGLLVLISWTVAVGIGGLLQRSLVQAWALKADEYPGWTRLFAGSWNWGWLIICISGSLVPIAGFVISIGTGSPIPTIVGWIVCWCIGWWKIGIPIGLWLNQEVRPTVG